jgi:cellulose synthase (UDP-forming)
MHRVGESNHRLWSRIGVFLSGLPEHASENKAVLDSPVVAQPSSSPATLAELQLRRCRVDPLGGGITEPFNYLSQSVFVILLWVVAMVIRRVPGRFPTLLLIMLSLIVLVVTCGGATPRP